MSDDIAETQYWFTVPEAAKYLRITSQTVYVYMKDGRLPFFYLAGTRQRRLKKDDLDALLEPGSPNELEGTDE